MKTLIKSDTILVQKYNRTGDWQGMFLLPQKRPCPRGKILQSRIFLTL